jgi:hypothetical protein
MTGDKTETRHLRIVEDGASASGKTKQWTVVTRAGVTLGDVAWFAQWRRYAFWPAGGVLLDRECMAELAAFLKLADEEHAQALAGRPVS